MKKTTFCVHIFEVSPYVLTQIMSGRDNWMWNLISHPTITHTAYFLRTPLPQKQEIPEKNVMMMSSSHFFWYFLFWGQQGPSKVCIVGIRWMQNQILHPMSSPAQNLGKNTGRYVKNTNKKSSFFHSSSKINNYCFIILTIILLFSLGGPFQTSNFL